MYKFRFENIPSLISAEVLEKGLFLWIWRPNKLPPHLGISQNGNYFSLLYDRKQELLTVASQFEIVKRKSLSMIWQEISTDCQNLEDVFSKYTSCSKDGNSCIQPILDSLKIKAKGGVLFDLLFELEKSNSIGKVYHFKLPKNFNGIKKYNRKEVESYLFNFER